MTGRAARRTDWLERAFWISPIQGGFVIAVSLAASWTVSYLLGGAGRVPPHWFYLPVLVAAVRFGAAGASVIAVASGFLAGPLLPLDVEAGTRQQLSDWVSRGVFFVAIGLIMAFVVGRLRAALGRELEVARSVEELARHKRMVIQTVSHEFLTPLTTIRGSIEFFGEPGVVVEHARPLVDGLARAADRLDGLVKSVLAAAETLIDPASSTKEQLVLREVCLRLGGAEGRARIDFKATPDADVVVSIRELVELALGALISNALKFSPPSSRVEITARRVPDGVEICVRDRGPGMTEDEVRLAFDPFTQKDPSYTRQTEGIGVGLFAARKCAELLGGLLWLRRADGGGTEAVLVIPE